MDAAGSDGLPTRAARTVAVALAVGLLAGAAAAPSPAMAPSTVADQESPEADNTVTRVELEADGDARWTVRIRTRLRTDADVEQYRAFQERFRENTSRFLDPFADRIRAVVANAANATGREMAAGNFSAATSIQEVPRRWGVVSYSFTWERFAVRDGERVVVGDAFEGGFFLAADDSLVVEAPPGYAVRRADPDPTTEEGDAVTWEGRRNFADGRPRVVLAPAATPTPATSPTPSAGQTPPGNTGPGGADGPSAGVLALLAVLGVLAVAGAVLLFRARGGRDGSVVGVGLGGGTDGNGGAASGKSADESGEIVPDGDAGGTAGADPPLTDAERVERLLAANGGRLKQADVADELGWSASKTSRVVGDMVEEGRVEKLRVGRENVLDLPE